MPLTRVSVCSLGLMQYFSVLVCATKHIIILRPPPPTGLYLAGFCSNHICPRQALAKSRLWGFEQGLLEQRGQMRHIALAVEEGRDERLVHLRHEASGQLVTAHLMDGWADMPVQPGDPANLIATLQKAPDGSMHAVCDHAQGASVIYICICSCI